MSETVARVFNVIEGGASAGNRHGSSLPPHDLGAEAAVLSAVILDPEKMGLVRDSLEPESFFCAENGVIWKACQALHDQNTPLDVVTVVSWLRANDLLKAAGGTGYIAKIIDETPAVANVEHYARVVYELRLQRVTMLDAQRLAADARAPVADVSSWLSDVSTSFNKLADGAVRRRASTAGEAAKAALDTVYASMSTPGMLGTRTWLSKLDEYTAGMHRRDFIVITAETGGGKTALAVTLAYNVAAYGGGVIFISLEMPREQLMSRVLARLAQINWHKVRLGHTDSTMFSKMIAANAKIGSLPIYIDDQRDLTIPMIFSIVRRERARMKKDLGVELKLVIVDYIQKVVGLDLVPPRSTREREMACVAKELVKLAEREEVPVIGLAQTNDDGLIRESRGIQFEATSWWHIEGVQGDGSPGPRAARVEIKKQRHGPFPATAACWFHPEYVYFSDDDRPEPTFGEAGKEQRNIWADDDDDATSTDSVANRGEVSGSLTADDP